MLNRSTSLAMSTSVLKALPDKLDIKRHSPSILYLLVHLGILDLDDKADDDPDDEILAELRKKQSELKAISQHNVTVTKKLYRLAKEMMDKQELRKKLAASDAEVS